MHRTCTPLIKHSGKYIHNYHSQYLYLTHLFTCCLNTEDMAQSYILLQLFPVSKLKLHLGSSSAVLAMIIK